MVDFHQRNLVRSCARGGHSAFLVLFSHFYVVIEVGSDHLCCFPCWLLIKQPHFALCPSMPNFLLLLERGLGRLNSAILLIGRYLGRHFGCDDNQVAHYYKSFAFTCLGRPQGWSLLAPSTFSFSIHFLFYIHLFHVYSSPCFLCLARYGFRLLPSFR